MEGPCHESKILLVGGLVMSSAIWRPSPTLDTTQASEHHLRHLAGLQSVIDVRSEAPDDPDLRGRDGDRDGGAEAVRRVAKDQDADQFGSRDSALAAEIEITELPERERLIVAAIDGERSVDQIAFVTHNADSISRSSSMTCWRPATRASSVSASTRWPTRRPRPEDPYEQASVPVVSALSFEPGNDVFAVSKSYRSTGARSSNRDFSRFLKRGPDSSATETLRP